MPFFAQEEEEMEEDDGVTDSLAKRYPLLERGYLGFDFLNNPTQKETITINANNPFCPENGLGLVSQA